MTIDEERESFESAGTLTLQEIWNGLSQVPVAMAWGGKNVGRETIQERYLCWRKGTPRIDIETEILTHRNWKP